MDALHRVGEPYQLIIRNMPDLTSETLVAIKPIKAGKSATDHGRIAALDGLRGVAILMVLWFHYYLGTQQLAVFAIDKLVIRILHLGGAGVDLFFVLSGFLITGILLDAKGGKGYFRNFYARRAFRIFPLYYGFLFVMLVLIPRVHPYRNSMGESIRDQIWLWLYGTNIARTFFHHVLAEFTPMWSLAVEEHFYLFWPAVVFLLTTRQLMVVCFSAMVLALAVRFMFAWQGLPAREFTLCCIDALAMGGLIAAVVRKERCPNFYRWSAKCIAAACFVTYMYLYATARTGNWQEQASSIIGASLIGVIMTCTVYLVVSPGATPWLKKPLEAAWLRSVGKYSYAMYMFHWTLIPPLMSLFSHFGLSRRIGSPFVAYLPFAICSTIICYLLAVASWHLYEKHFLKLKRFFEYGTASNDEYQEMVTFNCAAKPQ
jgi:peptidoglycan/LPS O-acetylase OafA/YrhL